jgi:hypothetical protein
VKLFVPGESGPDIAGKAATRLLFICASRCPALRPLPDDRAVLVDGVHPVQWNAGNPFTALKRETVVARAYRDRREWNDDGDGRLFGRR